jgi:uncharacterized repeat protein (TIGR03803 family)
MFKRMKKVFVEVAALLLLPVACRAASYSVLHHFPTNSSPHCTLIQGGDGAFYGTTQGGGDHGYGAVFRLTPSGDFTNLVSFNNVDGAYPYAGLTQTRDGALYGTAQNGGVNGYGTVFRLMTNGGMTVLTSFSLTNGAYPKGVLLEGDDGALYGTTFGGGDGGVGTVFRVTTNGELSTLVSFAVTNGSHPFSGLTRGSDGALYGTTLDGGPNPSGSLANFGSVYRITTNGELTSLKLFEGYGAANPYGGLVPGTDGLLHGATSGTVFSITTNGVLKTIASFSGLYPDTTLLQYFDGAFYGTTTQGGGSAGGSVFRVTTNGLISSMVEFHYPGPTWPEGGLLRGSDGALYGTATQGGAFGGGAVFRVEVASSIFLFPLVKSTNGWEINFNGLPGDTYRVLRATDPDGPWMTITNVASGEFGDGHCVDNSPPQGRAFYRLAYP